MSGAAENRGGGEGRRRGRMAPVALACALIAGPGAAEAAERGAHDPLEGLNRAFFHVHQVLDRVLIRPAAMVYTHVLPSPIRKGLKNAVSNLGEPAIFVNDLLQGRGGTAARTAARFTVNSTAGLAGLLDVAKPAGLPHHDNDFGITLARYGVASGPYLFLPLVGPLTLRDGFGEAANLALDPLFYVHYRGDTAVTITALVAGGLQERADHDQDLKAIYASATDPYASMRSYYLQNRQSEITGGKVDLETLPAFDEPAAPPSPAPEPAATPEPPSPGQPPGQP